MATTKFIILKLLLLAILSFITAIFLLPYPTKEINLADGLLLNPDKKTINFSANPPVFNSAVEIFKSSINIQSTIKYYDLHFSNSHKEYDLSYVFIFDENDPLLFYLRKEINILPPETFSDNGMRYGHATAIIKAGENKVIKAIPIEIQVVDKFGSSAECGWSGLDKTETLPVCPNFSDPKKYFEILESNIRIYATPSLFNWWLNLLLILAFWIVILNNLLAFLKFR